MPIKTFLPFVGPLTTGSKSLTLAAVLLPEYQCKASKLPLVLIRAPREGAVQIARGSDPVCSFIYLVFPATCLLSAAELNTEAF